jgi:hypothetical protein
MSKRITVAVVALIIVALPLVAQNPNASSVERQKMIEAAKKDGPTPKYVRAETPEQRKARLGTVEDPGLDPDPETVWWRFGAPYKIEKFQREWAAYDQPTGYVRPMAMANFAFEIYQQNDKHVWVWIPQATETQQKTVLSGDAPAAQVSPYTPAQLDYLKFIVNEYEALDVAPAGKGLAFEESSEGLPQSGSWRNSAAVADMNGDGFMDIIAPPQRSNAQQQIPAIWLGDGKGGWKNWGTVVWPYEIQYGGVTAGDFNGDKKMDLAFGVHFIGVRVFLHDGKGNFRDASQGMQATDFTTRKVLSTDVDQDGDTDIVAIYEGPGPRREGTPGYEGGKIRVFLNEGKASKWRTLDVANPKDYVGGDWLAIGKFNDDKFPDFVGSSNYFQGTDIMFRSVGRGVWEKVDGRDGKLVPFLSMYSAVTAARVASKKIDDAIVSFQRNWPEQIDPALIARPNLRNFVGIDRVSFESGEPKRVPIVRYDSTRPITGMASADFDRDGNMDLIYTKFDPREFVVLLGDGKGGFRRAQLSGLIAENKPNYDLTIADMNKDGRPDVLVMYESTAQSAFGKQDGAIKVFLNRGVVAADTKSAAAAR